MTSLHHRRMRIYRHPDLLYVSHIPDGKGLRYVFKGGVRIGLRKAEEYAKSHPA